MDQRIKSKRAWILLSAVWRGIPVAPSALGCSVSRRNGWWIWEPGTLGWPAPAADSSRLSAQVFNTSHWGLGGRQGGGWEAERLVWLKEWEAVPYKLCPTTACGFISPYTVVLKTYRKSWTGQYSFQCNDSLLAFSGEQETSMRHLFCLPVFKWQLFAFPLNSNNMKYKYLAIRAAPRTIYHSLAAGYAL